MQFENKFKAASSCAVEDEAFDCGLRHPEGTRDCGLQLDDDNPKSQIANPKSRSAARPLRVMFLQTDMRIGGAEVVTANILRRLDRQRFAPELCCLKQRGALGEELAGEIPVHDNLLSSKYDLRVWPRLTRLLRTRHVDAVVTVGAGDKMFWGRLAAWRAGVPVILSALHSTGWPDRVGRLNRLLTPITDAFIAVAEAHGRFLVQHGRFPERKVTVIRNGVDTDRFAPGHDVIAVRRELGLGETDPVVGIVAALRPEKNHELFLEMARRVVSHLPAARFLVVGEGPRREPLEGMSRELGLQSHVQFLGSRNDVPRLLSAMDVFALTSHVEANPVSILEAMSIGRPVVATNVGSIHEAVSDGKTGFLVPPGDATKFSERILQLLHAPLLGHSMGTAGRQAVLRDWSLGAMVGGYERLIESVFEQKMSVVRRQLSVAAS
ncbi:MAG TPA: glycosyltransferase [Lacipirellulaceae bacterium]|jgi:glycosyltransferase involved in cell wall biosynthesis|nr:glycosyltransferase [Lacipirellulaceae bacterium]